MTAFVVVWEDDNERDAHFQIFARCFESNGSPTTGNIRVQESSQIGTRPRVAVDRDGNFVVVWRRLLKSKAQIRVRGFFADGSARFSERLVNKSDGWFHHRPQVAMSRSGNFVIAWEDGRDETRSRVFIRGFTPDGEELFSEREVGFDGTDGHGYETMSQFCPTIAMAPDGHAFAVAWSAGLQQSTAQRDWRGGLDTQDWRWAAKVWVRAYNDQGVPKHAAQPANPEDLFAAQDYWPAIAMDEGGNYVVVWEDVGLWIRASHFEHDGTLTAGPIPVWKPERVGVHNGWRHVPRVAIEGVGGRFTVVWEEDSTNDGLFQIWARTADSTGDVGSLPVAINSIARGQQLYPDVALSPKNHGLVFVWQDDKDENGVYQVRGRGLSDSGSTIFSDRTINKIAQGHQLKPAVAVRLDPNPLLECLVSSLSRGAGVSDDYDALVAIRDNLLASSKLARVIYRAFYNSYLRQSAKLTEIVNADLRLRALSLRAVVEPLISYLTLASSLPNDWASAPEQWRAFFWQTQQRLDCWAENLVEDTLRFSKYELQKVIGALSRDELAGELRAVAQLVGLSTDAVNRIANRLVECGQGSERAGK